MEEGFPKEGGSVLKGKEELEGTVSKGRIPGLRGDRAENTAVGR